MRKPAVIGLVGGFLAFTISFFLLRRFAIPLLDRWQTAIVAAGSVAFVAATAHVTRRWWAPALAAAAVAAHLAAYVVRGSALGILLGLALEALGDLLVLVVAVLVARSAWRRWAAK